MKRYTVWETAPMIWHTLLMFFSVPLSTLTGLFDFWSLTQPENSLAGTEFEAFGASLLLLSAALIGILITAEVGLVRRKWFGPCALWACYGLQILFGLLFVGTGAIIGDSAIASTGLGSGIAAVIFLAIGVVYYQKRRALFAPAPVWFTPVETSGDARAERKPEELAMEKKESTGGYSAVYRAAEPERVPEPVAVLEKAPEAPVKETEDGVELLMQIQAEEEAKRASFEPPAPQEKRRGAPVWSVVTLGALCVALAVTVGVLGWQWQKADRERALAVDEAASVAADLEKAQTDRDRLKRARESAVEEKNEYQEKYQDAMDDYYDAAYYRDTLNEKIGFIVDGSQYYHTVDCVYYTSAEEYWAHNIEYCIYLGYSRCPLCHKDVVSRFGG